jgi:flagellar M-ring protein FliF
MDFINKAFAQVSDLFKSMTPGARITAGLLLAVVVVSLGYLTKYQVSSADEYLNGAEPFTNGELMAAEAAFNDAGLNDYEIQGNRIRVPKSKRAQYQGALATAGIFVNPGAHQKNIEGGPFQSKDERLTKGIIAKQNDLAIIIRNMKGVEIASVIYDQITKPGFRKGKQATATVSVKAIGGQALNEKMIPAFRQLVSGSFAGLSPENVIVIDMANGRSFSADGGGGMGPTGDKHGATKRMYERDWTAKILRALTFVDGVQVAIDAELTLIIEQAITDQKIDKTPTTLTSDETLLSTTSSARGVSGRPGLEPQGGGTANASSAVNSTTGGQTNTKEESSSSQQSVAGQIMDRSRIHALTPKRITVAIAVPTTYFERIWQAQNPPPEGEEAKKPTGAELQPVIQAESTKISEIVAQLVPLPEGLKELTELVTVRSFVPITPEPIIEPGMTDHAMDWLGTNWSTLGMTGLAFFSLFMLRSMVRSGGGEALAPAPARRERDNNQDDDDEFETNEDGVKEPKLKRFGESGPSLREELSDLVQEDPDAAANILRGWIASGA